MDNLASVLRENLVGHGITDMFGESNKMSFQFGGIGRERCRILTIVDFIEEFKYHNDAAVWSLTSEALKWGTSIGRFDGSDIHDVSDVFQT